MNRHQEEIRLENMIESGHITDMTLQEITSILKKYRERVVDDQKVIQQIREKLRFYLYRNQELQENIERGRGTPAQQRKWREMMDGSQLRIQDYTQDLSQRDQRLATLQERITLLETTLAAKAAPAAVPPSEAPPLEATNITLHVQLLSGEVKTVQVDRRDPISGFADRFAAAHGYRQTDRLIFLLPPQDSVLANADQEAEEKETIFWDHQHRHVGQTYQDLVGQASEVHLLLMVQPLNDPEWASKVELIRKIALAEKRYAPSSDEIFSHYSMWIMTQGNYANRYLRLKAFVDQHADVFYPVSEERFEQVKAQCEVDEFRSWYLDLERVRASELGQRYRPDVLRNIHYFLQRRPVHSTQLLNRVIEFYLSSLTREELFATGIRIDHIRPGKIRSYLADWDDWIARAFPK